MIAGVRAPGLGGISSSKARTTVKSSRVMPSAAANQSGKSPQLLRIASGGVPVWISKGFERMDLSSVSLTALYRSAIISKNELFRTDILQLRTLDLESLRIFRAVVETGGITSAAAQLGRVQSNITSRIQTLEDRLGTRLFRRERNRLILSEDGARLLTYAERLLQLADEAELALKPGCLRGTLKIGALESTTAARLPPLLAAYHARHPDVRLDLITGDTTTLLRRVARFEVEAAFVSEPFDSAGLGSQPAFAEQLALIAPTSMPPIKAADDLRGRTMVVFETGCSYRKIFEDWLASAQVQPDRVMELASYHAIFACVMAGAGVGIMPRAVLEALNAGDRVQILDLPREIGHVKTHLVWRSSQPSRAFAALQEMLLDFGKCSSGSTNG